MDWRLEKDGIVSYSIRYIENYFGKMIAKFRKREKLYVPIAALWSGEFVSVAKERRFVL